MSRIAPAEPPYAPPIAAALERIMPPRVPPLALFRTLARSPRVFARMFAGGLLDKGPLTLRQREIVIDRTTARLGCEYEWGVHVAFFAGRAGLTAEQVAATVRGPADSPVWSPDDRALIGLVDDLVDRRTIAAPTWQSLRASLDEAQILEAIALVGYYHTISFFCVGLELPLEAYAARFPSGAGSRPD
jgi:alkylhydroperoxidase family enzyme